MSSDYDARHWRVRKVRGPARQYLCVFGCGRQARDWAQIHGTDGEDPQTYMAVCRKCHIGYDQSGHRQPHTESARQKMSASQRRSYAEGRRVGQNSFQSGKTHCPAGHEYTEENTRVNRDGSRTCKPCARDTVARWRARQREGGGAGGDG